MDVGVLGPLIVRVDGREATPGPAKQRALLALLVVHHNEVLPVDTLIEGIWGGRPPATAHKIIQGYISQVRRTLGGDDLQTRPGGYRLELAPDDLDAERFEALLERGRGRLAADPAAAADLLGQALRLWRGPALAEFGSLDFAVREADRLEQLRLLALEGRIEADIALGRHAAVIPELQALTRGYPLREDLRALQMLALYRAGRQGEALAAYAEARRTLVTELGIEPGETLGRLEHAILVHDPALDPPAQEHRAAWDPRPLSAAAAAPARTVRPPEPLPTGGSRRTRRHRRSFALMTCAAIVAAAAMALAHPGPPG